MSEILIDIELQWDLLAQVLRRDGAYWGQPDAASGDVIELIGPLHVLSEWPLWVAGVLPPGVVGVAAAADGEWRADAAQGVWLAGRQHVTAPQIVNELSFVNGDGSHSSLPPMAAADLKRIERHVRVSPTLVLDDAGRAYAGVLVAALLSSLVDDPVAGGLLRVVIRWFSDGDPLYLTLHGLGCDDQQPAPEDRWHPLQWANVDREFARTDRVMTRSDVLEAGEALVRTFPHDEEGEVDGAAHLPAVREAVRLLTEALDAAAVPRAPRCAVAAAHFEGWGARESLAESAWTDLLDVLADRGELPED